MIIQGNWFNSVTLWISVGLLVALALRFLYGFLRRKSTARHRDAGNSSCSSGPGNAIVDDHRACGDFGGEGGDGGGGGD
ncbi:hypothetical protein M1D96_12150 [Pseudomonas sp. D1-3]|uniref:hypothetical protein n=1 Tax=Phytopseudomonas argentinensis TaxID=289370 RepID=UPI0011137C22|nr:hypothetical protein [Pseudomonas argentinensis]